MDVIGAEDVRMPARRLSSARCRSGLPLAAQPAPGVGRRLTGPIWSKLTTLPSAGAVSHKARIRAALSS